MSKPPRQLLAASQVLKECPFDGGTRLVVVRTPRYDLAEHPQWADEPDAYAFNVHCTSCASDGPWKKSQSGAEQMWNGLPGTTRHDQDTPLSESDRQLLGLALRTLRSHLERKADADERKLALPTTDPNFVHSEDKRAWLKSLVRNYDSTIADIEALYGRLKLPDPIANRRATR